MSLIETALKRMRAAGPGVDATRKAAIPPMAPAGMAQHPVRRVGDGTVVTVDTRRLRDSGLLPAVDVERFEREFRQVKRRLLDLALGRTGQAIARGQLILVASASSGDGKTFASMNLALSFAKEHDLRVLLVDADLPKPQVTRELGLLGRRGLVDALRDEALDVETLICESSIPGLQLLGAGSPAPEDGTELLHSERMGVLAQGLVDADPRRIVLFDSAPLLMATEGQVLSAHVGQVLLVVREGVTGQGQLLEALTTIARGPEIGLMFSQSTSEPGPAYQYQNYGDRDPGSEAR